MNIKVNMVAASLQSERTESFEVKSSNMAALGFAATLPALFIYLQDLFNFGGKGITNKGGKQHLLLMLML